jgi:hypothetical protein
MELTQRVVDDLAGALVLGTLLERVRQHFGEYELIDHWQQGEFHHDTVLRVGRASGGAAPVLVVATNCNGGVKEVLGFAEPPERLALWRARCPDNPEFSGTLPDVLASAKTAHWFDPCELLHGAARSEYREEHRERQRGGGWMLRKKR